MRRSKKAKEASANAVAGSDSRRLLAGLPPERRQAVLEAARNTPGLVLSEGALKTTLTVEKAVQRNEGEARAAARASERKSPIAK